MNTETITLQDCIDMHEKKGYVAILNDGKLVQIQKESSQPAEAEPGT